MALPETLSKKEDDEIRLINALLYNARTRELMKSQKIHSAVNHGGLTIAFLPNNNFPKDRLFTGLDHFLGNAHCAGVRMVRGQDVYNRAIMSKAYIDANHSLDAIVRQGNL